MFEVVWVLSLQSHAPRTNRKFPQHMKTVQMCGWAGRSLCHKTWQREASVPTFLAWNVSHYIRPAIFWFTWFGSSLTTDIKKSFLRYEYMTITSCFPSLTPKSICNNLLVPLPFAILQKFPPVALWNPFCCSRWFHLGGSDGIVVSHVELPNCVEPDFAWVRNGLEGPCNKKRCKGMQNMVPCQSCPSVVWIHDIPAMGGHARGGTLKICLGHVKRCVCCSFLSGFKKKQRFTCLPAMWGAACFACGLLSWNRTFGAGLAVACPSLRWLCCCHVLS